MNNDSQIVIKTSRLAVASIICSILSITLMPLACFPGIICGHLAKSELKKSNHIKGKGIAIAGLIISYFSLAIFIILILFATLGFL
ncbi:DUF4190 domain-containing protein [Desulfospira joergensenii]|uniref:DUF4190 domain-containing protein n=1 Tax=Desulfospira joergensenii TaxID=53329 RepID=UPI0009FBB64A|nr:DUF4190 domain-containing protein [Desulfospira joergensenii]